MYHLTNEIVKENLKYFTCSYGEIDDMMLIDYGFEPESFTVYEKLVGNDTIYFHDLGFEEWCSGMVQDQLSKIDLDIDKDTLIDALMDNIRILLHYCDGGRALAKQIYNQEFIDIIRRVMFYTIYGSCDSDLDTAKEFNDLAYSIVPEILTIIEQNKIGIQDIFLISVASGMVGLDMKGAPAAASNYINQGIPIAKYRTTPPKIAADEIFRKLEYVINNSDKPVFYWQDFMESIHSAKKISWMTDDYIESFFDLLFIQTVLKSNNSLNIEIIPKNGRFGNDLSWKDLERILNLSVFKELSYKTQSGQFTINRYGPQMGAANLRKLSKQCYKSFFDSDFVVTKGCRIHEMIQGGLNKKLYSSYIVTRELSQIVTGFNTERTPILLLMANPGEYLFWGVNQGDSVSCYHDNKLLGAMCCSTIKMHEDRKKMQDKNELECEYNYLKQCFAHYKGNKKPVEKELQELRRIIDATCYS